MYTPSNLLNPSVWEALSNGYPSFGVPVSGQQCQLGGDGTVSILPVDTNDGNSHTVLMIFLIIGGVILVFTGAVVASWIYRVRSNRAGYESF